MSAPVLLTGQYLERQPIPPSSNVISLGTWKHLLEAASMAVINFRSGWHMSLPRQLEPSSIWKAYLPKPSKPYHVLRRPNTAVLYLDHGCTGTNVVYSVGGLTSR